MVINTKLFAVIVVVVLVAMGSVATALIATSHPDTTNTVSNSTNATNSTISNAITTSGQAISTSGTTTSSTSTLTLTSGSSTTSTTTTGLGSSSSTTSTSTTISTTTTYKSTTATFKSTTSTVPPTNTSISNNTMWGGFILFDYIDANVANRITNISGSWVVPTLDCGVTPNASMVEWVGISGPPLAQLGTGGDCIYGGASYFVWSEFWPNQPYIITYGNMYIFPGDMISASVYYNYSSKNFTMTLTDDNRPGENSLIVIGNYPGATLNSAEWIVEAINSNLGPLIMPDFNSTQFSNNYATINGLSQSLLSWAGNPNYSTGRLNYCNDGVDAKPSQLTASDNFTIVWSSDSSC